MARQEIDLLRDNLGKLLYKSNANFEELYNENLQRKSDNSALGKRIDEKLSKLSEETTNLKSDLSQLSEEIANISEPMNDLDALAALSECSIITPAYQDWTFYTDADGAIYIL